MRANFCGKGNKEEKEEFLHTRRSFVSYLSIIRLVYLSRKRKDGDYFRDKYNESLSD